MKRFGNPLLSVAAPLLICLSLFAYFQREGKDRAQVLPSFCVGTGIIIYGLLRRSQRRKIILARIIQIRSKT